MVRSERMRARSHSMTAKRYSLAPPSTMNRPSSTSTHLPRPETGVGQRGNEGAVDSWVQTPFEIDGRRVVVSVKRLDDGDAERFAASLAWFACAAEMPGVNVDEAGWPKVLQEIMSKYVALTVDDVTLSRLESLSTKVCAVALQAFVQANQLAPALRRHLCQTASSTS